MAGLWWKSSGAGLLGAAATSGVFLYRNDGKAANQNGNQLDLASAQPQVTEIVNSPPGVGGRMKLQTAIDLSTKYLESCILEKSIPGLVVGVSQRGHTLWMRGFGFADVENSLPCTPYSVMRIASISKAVTMALAAKLVEQGKLDLDLPIRNYLSPQEFPDKQYNGQKVDITLRQLVSHLGGIRHYKKEPNEKGDTTDEMSLKEYYLKDHFDSVTDSLKMFKDDPLIAQPGTKYEYTTFGWTLISACIEKVLQKEKGSSAKFETYLAETFCRDTLGLRSTFLDENDPIIRGRVKYYKKAGKGDKAFLLNVPYVDNSYKWAGGGLVSNVPDLLRFGNIMLSSYLGVPINQYPAYLQKKLTNELMQPIPLTCQSKRNPWSCYGMGFSATAPGVRKVSDTLVGPSCGEPPFERYFGHTGAAVGASSALVVIPQEQLVVVILTNLHALPICEKMALKVAENFANRQQNLKSGKEIVNKSDPNDQ